MYYMFIPNYMSEGVRKKFMVFINNEIKGMKRKFVWCRNPKIFIV